MTIPLRIPALLAALLAGSLSTGCVARAQMGGSVYAGDPNLVYVEPGVYVVAERSQPTFYSDGYYWLYDDGMWWRSSYSSGGWVVVRNVPMHVRGIHNPRTYVNYQRPRQNERVQVYDHRGQPDVRDHRNPPGAYGSPGAYDHRGQPDVRDHRSPGQADPVRDPRRQAPGQGPTYQPPRHVGSPPSDHRRPAPGQGPAYQPPRQVGSPPSDHRRPAPSQGPTYQPPRRVGTPPADHRRPAPTQGKAHRTTTTTHKHY